MKMKSKNNLKRSNKKGSQPARMLNTSGADSTIFVWLQPFAGGFCLLFLHLPRQFTRLSVRFFRGKPLVVFQRSRLQAFNDWLGTKVVPSAVLLGFVCCFWIGRNSGKTEFDKLKRQMRTEVKRLYDETKRKTGKTFIASDSTESVGIAPNDTFGQDSETTMGVYPGWPAECFGQTPSAAGTTGRVLFQRPANESVNHSVRRDAQ